MRRALLLLIICAAGCSSKPVTSKSPTPEPSPSPAVAASSPAPAPESTAISQVPTGGAALDPEGRYNVLLKKLEGNKIEVDVVEFLSGDAARQAAVEDGLIKQGETLDNDYYIRNRSKAVRSVEVAPNAAITLLDCRQECRSVKGDLDTLSRFLAGGFSDGEYYGSPDQPFVIKLEGGKLAMIDAVYTP